MKYCGEQGCKKLIASGRYCDEHRRRSNHKPSRYRYKSFYNSQAWKDLKSDCYQRDKGCCVECGKLVYGKQVHHHHKIPIAVQPNLKLDKDNVVTVCNQCHNVLENELNVIYHHMSGSGSPPYHF
ncbi:HNH endonuclease [Gracilibacillus boraciitolerans]|uniref:HNH endonuclease n=1 Tax=Gracilibacillus boraciitolerans TaxID=307521 RepID=UPI000A07B66C|nr:HNH endonuclease [Gracilibacillus boraciitolerans]